MVCLVYKLTKEITSLTVGFLQTELDLLYLYSYMKRYGKCQTNTAWLIGTAVQNSDETHHRSVIREQESFSIFSLYIIFVYLKGINHIKSC